MQSLTIIVATSSEMCLCSSAHLFFTMVATAGAAVSPKLTHVGTATFQSCLPPRPSGLTKKRLRCMSSGWTLIMLNIFLMSPEATCSAALKLRMTEPKWFIGFLPLDIQAFRFLPFLSG